MKIQFLATLVILLSFVSCSDDHNLHVNDQELACNSARFTEQVFTDIDSSTVVFAEQNFMTEHPSDLKMDIYFPKNDLIERRPVIIWAFGGAFIQGERSDMHILARDAAKRGFVSASIDYRLLQTVFPPPDTTTIMHTVVKAASDMKAAVRYMRKDAQTDNVYGIDPSNIYVGGISAGAITSLLVGLGDDGDFSSPFLKEIVDAHGGIEGNSGLTISEGYSSNVKGVLNLSGAVYDDEFIDASDPPVFSVHGDQDEVVPYAYDYVSVLGFQIIKLFGSKAMLDRSEEVGHMHELITIQGGGHTDIYVEPQYEMIRDEFIAKGFSFLKDNICQ